MAETNPLDWLSQLPQLDNYSGKDQYHDFRKVFMGTPEGQRVLRRIVELGAIFNEPALVSPIDPLMIAAEKGRRFMALKIFSIVNNEPPEPPKEQTRKRK